MLTFPKLLRLFDFAKMPHSEMKMTAKSEAEDDDSWIEAEIERELEKLTIDSCPSDDENSDKITDEVTPDKDSYLLREVGSKRPLFSLFLK